ncbi:MAG: SIMPL domain-containing protein [Bacteroidaceae bacterium]|nr:SIMPL domain-containing protein [Bacteroidaceae bacterium]MCI6371979.1 SIMPL domain-containing protein [Paraprevotella sp.]MDD6821919.1 SIMPL domain-containing protein [Paraprevotella sp.]MDD7098796.1 SIMPL domain-containing protein [Paraprevotella sp.]MDY3820740.1 SIMPL domain-containing protein [Bacteroidaceae bacterium]
MNVNSKGLILSAIIVAMGLTAMGVAIRNGIVTFKDRDRCVVVKGLAEREVKANKVSWPLTYKELGNDPSEMYSVIERKNKKVVEFLKAGGIKEEEISVNSPTISDRQANTYNNEVMTYRYVAKSVITVTSTNVDLVRTLITRQAELMRQGIALISEEYGTDQIKYDFTGLNEVKPAMVEEATKNARATAQKFADDSECALGGIRSAQQGQFSIESRDENTPYIKKIRVVNTIEYSLK